jgi:Protein of unknown function (DUF2778)
MVLDRSRGTLTVDDLDSLERPVTINNVFTGGGTPSQRAGENRFFVNNPAYEWAKDIGPIPSGRYEIIENPSRKNYYRLDPIDDNPRNDRDDRYRSSAGPYRDGYRLHPGGTSLGCVTIGGNTDSYKNPPQDWYKIQNILERTSTEIIYDRTPSRNPLHNPAKLHRYGILVVR